MNPRPESIPTPDPTRLTTEAVDRLKEELMKIIDLRVDHSKEVRDQKFIGVATEFTMRDIALAAAFKAAEAAVKQQNESNTLAADKAAASFTKQIDTLDEKINDLKERMSELTSKNYSSLGGYIVGVVGIISIVATIIIRLQT